MVPQMIAQAVEDWVTAFHILNKIYYNGSVIIGGVDHIPHHQDNVGISLQDMLDEAGSHLR